MSKTYTAAAVLKLVDEGKVELDAPVTAYLPDFTMADGRYTDITVRMLLNHSSGLPGSTIANGFLLNDPDTLAADTLLEELSGQTLKAEPGAFSVYCNDGFTLAELVVEAVSGMDFDDYMRQAILEAKNEQDSVGGAIECAVFGLPAGLGAPDFGRNVEGIFAQHLFAVPAVKGVDFGAGVAFSLMRGSEANDPFEVKDGRVVTKTNHAGGVNGGVTNGMPVTFEVTIRPTPSIALPQESVDLRTGEETEIEIKGRHDPCIVPRAVPVIEAAAALAACEVLGI